MDPKPRKPARPIDDDFRPRKKKSDSDNNPMIFIIVGAAAGGLVVVVAGILGFLLLSKKPPEKPVAATPAPVVAKAPEVATQAPAPEATPQPKPVEWVWFELPEPKSYAAFPNGKPSLVPSNPAGGESLTAGLIESTRYTMMDDKKTYSMVVLKMPSELGIIGITPEALLETVMSDRSKLLLTDGAKVDSVTQGNLKGLPYYYLVTTKSTGKGLICVYAVGTTLVALRVEGKELKPEDINAKHFLSSYQLKKEN